MARKSPFGPTPATGGFGPAYKSQTTGASAMAQSKRGGSESTLKRILRPGLKRSSSGSVIQDRRPGRVGDRMEALSRRAGPYRNYKPPRATGALRKRNY